MRSCGPARSRGSSRDSGIPPGARGGERADRNGGDRRHGPSAAGIHSARRTVGECDLGDQVSQPNPLSSGTTQVVQQTSVQAQDKPVNRIELKEGATVEDLVQELQRTGAGARDVISILQAMKEAGALEADSGRYCDAMSGGQYSSRGNVQTQDHRSRGWLGRRTNLRRR